jgi:hypothetical protein
MDLVERHIEGEGPILLVIAGEPGIGKSRLLHEAVTYARKYGFRVLRGDSHRRLVEPYAPISEALAHHLQAVTAPQRQLIVRSFPWLVRMFPEFASELREALPSLPRAGETRLMFEAIVQYLVSPSADGADHALGTLLVLDDLQWAGADALELLSAVIRSGSQPLHTRGPLRVIGAYRDTEVQSNDALSVVLSDLIPGRLATELALAPLDPEASAQLVEHLLPENKRDMIDPIVQAAGGIPFFVTGLALEARQGRPGVPLDLMQSVRARVIALTKESQEILEIASLIGGSLQHEQLLTVSGLGEAAFAPALDALHRAKLLVAVGEAFSLFPSEVIRAVVEGDIGSATRTMLRRRIDDARTLRETDSKG